MLIGILLLTVIAGCLLLIDALINEHDSLSEADHIARNRAASELYLTLATLAQPVTSSDIKRTLLSVVREDDRIQGATLFDVKGQLVAQLGTGNDKLLQRPAIPTARIPIRSTDNALYGHAVLAFKPHKDSWNSAFHSIAAIAICALLVVVIIGLLKMHRRLPSSVSRPVTKHQEAVRE